MAMPRFDWAGVDWERRDVAIARDLGCTVAAVRYQRRRMPERGRVLRTAYRQPMPGRLNVFQSRVSSCDGTRWLWEIRDRRNTIIAQSPASYETDVVARAAFRRWVDDIKRFATREPWMRDRPTKKE